MPVPSMAEIVDDLVAEQDALDAALAPVEASRWESPSPAEGWLLRDCIAHLTEFDEAAAHIIASGEWPDRATAPQPPLSGFQADARALTVDALIERWRAGRSRLAEALRPLDAKARLPWTPGNPMSARSMATARLMECWSHGLDALEAAGVEPVDTDRLRHIAHIGYITREFAYRNRGLQPNATPLRVDLIAPSGARWSWGPDDVPARIRGTAGDFCRVVTQRIHVSDTALVWEGEAAGEFLTVAPAPGRRPAGCRRV